MQKKLKFEYRLKYDECYETFYLLSMRWSRRTRKILAAILTAIAVIMLVLYAKDNQGIHYFFIALLAILMLAYLLYVPALKARKGARSVSRQNGVYRVELAGDGKIRSGREVVELKGDKDARVIETDTIFAIRPDRIHTFCLPKRIMSEEEIAEVRSALKM